MFVCTYSSLAIDPFSQSEAVKIAQLPQHAVFGQRLELVTILQFGQHFRQTIAIDSIEIDSTSRILTAF